MHKVKYSKAETAIWGCAHRTEKSQPAIVADRHPSIEKIGIYKKKKAEVIDSSKAGVEKVTQKISETASKEQEAVLKLKRDVLHGRSD